MDGGKNKCWRKRRDVSWRNGRKNPVFVLEHNSHRMNQRMLFNTATIAGKLDCRSKGSGTMSKKWILGGRDACTVEDHE